MRSRLLAVAVAVVGVCGPGCVSFPNAHLLQGQAAFEVVSGPVVCGPVGFRQVPLQSRWGEYVRVTVAAPSALRGTVLVHANGVAQEAQAWSTEAGAMILEARFPNESVERPYALERERPIDITLTGLQALGGGTCEGAVFTVEHGALRPSIDERAWIAELTRRGGPELAARLEAARLEADVRRQAHYAQWASRHVEVSAELLAQESAIREAHYAQWDARHQSPEAVVVANQVEEQGDSSLVVAGGSSTVVSGGSSLVVPGGSSTVVSGGSSLVVAGGSSTVCGTPGLASSGVQVQGGSSLTVAGGSSPVCGAPALASSGVQGGGVMAGPGALAMQGSSSVARVDASPLRSADSSLVAVSSPGEWSQPPEASLRASASVESAWVQPFEPRLEPVAVTTESQVATALPAPRIAPQVVVAAEPVDPALGMLVPAFFQVLFNVAAAGPPQRYSPPVHGARPIPPGGR
jgi:hypothetical protein